MAYSFSSDTSRQKMAVGYLAAGVTVLIWASWLVVTRHSAGTGLGTIELGFFRFGIPALVLAPVWWRQGVLPKNLPLHVVALMVLGGGALFFQATAHGLHLSEAGFSGVLLGGAMPFATAVIGVAIFRNRLDGARSLGLMSIVCGSATLLLPFVVAGGLNWSGVGMILAGATLWASYTHAFRQSGLSALHASAIVAFWSSVIQLALAAIHGVDFTGVAWSESGLQLVSQGILSGLVATFTYGVAVRSLGGIQAAAFTALTPVLAVLGGALLLGEQPSTNVYLAAAFTCVGVLLTTGLLSKSK
jgi:drug/metabolite transporter (DMT)-like permease